MTHVEIYRDRSCFESETRFFCRRRMREQYGNIHSSSGLLYIIFINVNQRERLLAYNMIINLRSKKGQIQIKYS